MHRRKRSGRSGGLDWRWGGRRAGWRDRNPLGLRGEGGGRCSVCGNWYGLVLVLVFVFAGTGSRKGANLLWGWKSGEGGGLVWLALHDGLSVLGVLDLKDIRVRCPSRRRGTRMMPLLPEFALCNDGSQALVTALPFQGLVVDDSAAPLQYLCRRSCRLIGEMPLAVAEIGEELGLGDLALDRQ